MITQVKVEVSKIFRNRSSRRMGCCGSHQFVFIIFSFFLASNSYSQQREVAIVQELFRLRNQHQADSAELLYADTVQVYMKSMRNIPRRKITEVDKVFWKSHPKNRFEITGPIQIKTIERVATAILYGKEFLDGTSFKKERIEIKFDRNLKIISFRGYRIR